MFPAFPIRLLCDIAIRKTVAAIRRRSICRRVLLQGSTVIASWQHNDIGTSYTLAEQSLTSGQFSAISDLTNLFLQFQTTWWLTDASIDLDLSNARYYDSSDPTVAVTDFLSCSRASIGYAKNAEGTLTQFGNDTLRITDLGLLVEDARTNYVLYSQEFDNTSVWDSHRIPSQ